MHFAFSFPSSFIHLYSFPTFQMKLPSLQWLGERLQGADMHGNGYSGDTAAFWGLSMRTVTNIHVSTSFFRFSEPTHHQTIHLKMRPSNLQGIENGSHDAALRGACSARHGMNGEGPEDLEQQLLRPNIAQGDPAVTDDFWCSSWTLKGLETHHLAKWTWQMFERYECFCISSEGSKTWQNGEISFCPGFFTGFWMFLDESIKTCWFFTGSFVSCPFTYTCFTASGGPDGLVCWKRKQRVCPDCISSWAQMPGLA